MALPEARHLGDGAYISYDGFQFWLTVNDHRLDHFTDKVAIDTFPIEHIAEYVKEVKGPDRD